VEPERSIQNKDQITKVMFRIAVARPRFDANGVCIFDGKIRMWPFVKREAAQQTSCNRARGTMETKPVNFTYNV
jgi:hypothetical protein